MNRHGKVHERGIGIDLIRLARRIAFHAEIARGQTCYSIGTRYRVGGGTSIAQRAIVIRHTDPCVSNRVGAVCHHAADGCLWYQRDVDADGIGGCVDDHRRGVHLREGVQVVFPNVSGVIDTHSVRPRRQILENVGSGVAINHIATTANVVLCDRFVNTNIGFLRKRKRGPADGTGDAGTWYENDVDIRGGHTHRHRHLVRKVIERGSGVEDVGFTRRIGFHAVRSRREHIEHIGTGDVIDRNAAKPGGLVVGVDTHLCVRNGVGAIRNNPLDAARCLRIHRLGSDQE